MTIHIDADKALELLEDVVTEKGADFVYEAPGGGCLYVNGNQPSCLVGHALVRAGVSIEVLSKLDGTRGSVPISSADLSDAATLSEAASYIFSVAQDLQDGDNTWGYALDKARQWGAA